MELRHDAKRQRWTSPSDKEENHGDTSHTYNVTSGRNGRLEQALRAMKVANVDVGVLMEAKLTKDIYTHHGSRQGTTCNTYTTRVRARKHERQTPPRQYFTL